MIWRNNAVASNSVSNCEKLLSIHFRCCNTLMERIVLAAPNATSAKKEVGRVVSRVEGSTLKETSLIKL
jgi:hypothetical protein